MKIFDVSIQGKGEEMRITPINNTQLIKQNYKRKHDNQYYPTEPIFAKQPNFKGKGLILGLGTGLATGLTIIGGAAIAGTFAFPALLGSIAILGSGAGGAYLGKKLESKINEIKKK